MRGAACLAARRPDLADDHVGDARVGTRAGHARSEIVHHDRSTSPVQIEGVQPPETASRAGDDGHLPAEVAHFRSERLRPTLASVGGRP